MSEHWIPISIFSYETEERLDEALATAYDVHLWALERLSDIFAETATIPHINKLEIQLTRYLHERGISRKNAGRYTLDVAMAKTILWFRDMEKHTSWTEGSLPEPVPREKYTDIDINTSRSLRGYLEKYGQVSVIYGMLTLEGEWQRTVQQQAKELRIAPAQLLNRWRSITIRREDGGHKIKFNARI